MRDLKIIDINTEYIRPLILDKTYDKYLSVYQKLLILLLSSVNSIYRPDGSGLTDLLGNINITNTNFLLTTVSSFCDSIMQSLDTLDAALIESINIDTKLNSLYITIQTTNNQIFKGVLI